MEINTTLVADLQVIKESYFLADLRTFKYLGDHKKKGIDPDLQVPQMQCDGKLLVWLPKEALTSAT